MTLHPPAAAAAAACLLLPAAPPPVHAQTAASETLPSITVTGRQLARSPALATGVATPPLETPFSQTSVDAELVRDQGGSTLQDALRNVPGAQPDSGFNGAHTQFFVLRGAVVDSGTGSNRILRDGVRLSNYPYVPAFVDSIDVLRGPGAAIGVRSEPGGTVNLSMRQPQSANGGSVFVAAGSHDAREVALDVNRVLAPQQGLAARLMVTRSDASEWRHVPDRLDGARLVVGAGDGPRWSLRLGAEATSQTYRPDYGLPALNGRPADVPRDRQLGEPFDDSTLHNRIADLHADAALGADTTRVAFDATHLRGRSTAVRNLLVGTPLAGQPAGTFARVTTWEPDTERRITSAAAALTHKLVSGAVTQQFHAGATVYDETLEQTTLSLPPATSPPIDVYAPVYGRVSGPPQGAALPAALTEQDLHAVGVSLQDTADIGAWSLVAGMRFDHQRFRYGSPAVLPVTESRWSPKVALLYRVDPDATVYANVGTGTAPNQVSSATNRSLPSRRSRQGELGWKALWNEGRLTSEVAAYRLDQTNMISADLSTPANGFDFTASGAARSQGVEASLQGELTPQMSVTAAYAYTDAFYRRNAVYGDKRVPNVALHAANVWARWRWDAAWWTGAALALQGRRYADEANTTTLGGHGRTDLVQGWRTALGGDTAVELQLALRNVFDKRYSTSSHLHVARWIMPGEGRNLQLQATLRF